MFSVFSFVYDDLYDEIPGIRSVVSPGRQSEAAAPGEKRIDGPYAPRPDRTFPYSAAARGPLPHTPVRPISCRFMPFHPAFNRFVFLSGIVFLRPKPKPRIFRTSRPRSFFAAPPTYEPEARVPAGGRVISARPVQRSAGEGGLFRLLRQLMRGRPPR